MDKLELTDCLGLMREMTEKMHRKECHYTVDGCRAYVEHKGYLYQVDIKPFKKLCEHKETRMGGQGMTVICYCKDCGEELWDKDVS